MPDGRVAFIVNGVAEEAAVRESSIPIPPGTPHAWAIATTAVLFQINGYRPDLLGGTVSTSENRSNAMKQLDDGWSISDRNELLKTLAWLQYSGHRVGFDEIGRKLDAISDSQYKSMLGNPSLGPEQQQKLEIVRKYHQRLGDKGILGWDLIRYIAVCRWAYVAGYLSEDEAWRHIMPAAARLQKSFDSWEDVESNYLIGRKFWSLSETEKQAVRFQSIFRSLLKDPASPWGQNPWRMELHVDNPLPIVSTDPVK
jgi:hypothetical protein